MLRPDYLRPVNQVQSLLTAIINEARLEFRRGYALGGLLVFVLCTVYIIFLTLSELPPAMWISLYWIAFLFLGVHTALKSFARESSRRYLYYYTLMSPELLFGAKCIYNSVLLSLLGFLMYGAMSLVLGNPIEDTFLFAAVIVCGGICISLAFTFVSGIAIKSDQSATLMTILSFPVIIPVLLSLVRLTQSALLPPEMSEVGNGFAILGAIALLLIGLGLILFPYLWRS